MPKIASDINLFLSRTHFVTNYCSPSYCTLLFVYLSFLLLISLTYLPMIRLTFSSFIYAFVIKVHYCFSHVFPVYILKILKITQGTMTRAKNWAFQVIYCLSDFNTTK